MAVLINIMDPIPYNLEEGPTGFHWNQISK